MWMVKNTLRATLTFRGLDFSIPAGQTYDLDALGRDRAESSNQVVVAFEEGYLENVHKAARVESDRLPTQAPPSSADGLTAAEFEARMKEFQRQFVSELRTHIPAFGQAQDAVVQNDVKQLVDEFKLLREHFKLERNKLSSSGNLSDAEIRARMAFLEEKEQELVKNFEHVGRRVETTDGDVMGKADLLSNL